MGRYNHWFVVAALGALGLWAGEAMVRQPVLAADVVASVEGQATRTIRQTATPAQPSATPGPTQTHPTAPTSHGIVPLPYLAPRPSSTPSRITYSAFAQGSPSGPPPEAPPP